MNMLGLATTPKYPLKHPDLSAQKEAIARIRTLGVSWPAMTPKSTLITTSDSDDSFAVQDLLGCLNFRP